MIDTLSTYALPIYFAAYFFFALVWRSFLVYRRTGIQPVVLPKSDDAHGYIGRAFKLVLLASAVVALLPVLTSDPEYWLGSYPLLHSPFATISGWIVLIAAFCWLLVAQTHMGSAWRVGIDTTHRCALVTHGLFAKSRNPIFLSMRMSLAGLFLVLPGALTLAIMVAGDILMQVQVRLEEQHLQALHGDAYAVYVARVRRWL